MVKYHILYYGLHWRYRDIVLYTSNIFCKVLTYLILNVSSTENGFHLLPGTHTYSFACVLPERLPTSFEGGHGHVRYTIKVTLERPWKFDHTFQAGFTVLHQLNLNRLSSELRVSNFKITF